MPSLESLGMAKPPSVDPRMYPGKPVSSTHLLMGQWIYPINASVDRRIGQWKVDVNGGPLANKTQGRESVHLNYALLLANAASMDFRFPVLSVGSNAAPGQLVHKFTAGGMSSVVPMTTAVIRGLSAGHSAHVSIPGYIPYVFMGDDRGVPGTFILLWLDEYQLACMDKSEPNYRLVPVQGERYPLTLESDEHVRLYSLYQGRWGALKWPGRDEPMVAGTQEAVYEELSREEWFQNLVPDGKLQDRMAALKADEYLRVKVREAMHDNGFTVRDQLVVSEQKRLPYRNLHPPAISPNEPVVRPTPEPYPRGGEPLALVNSKTPGVSGHSHVVVTDARRTSGPSAVARVAVDASRAFDDVVYLDQSLRNGIGVEIGDGVILRPASVKATRLADAVVCPKAYVLCRVQVASLPTVEQSVCSLDPTVLQILGLTDGDQVVVEGVPTTGQLDVPSIRLRGFATPAEIEGQRRLLSGGDLTSRFPDARDALGVFPDLPWIFLDRGSRSLLGLRDIKLAVVRVRASRTYQIGKELREMLLLLALAFIGLISILDTGWERFIATAVIILLAAVAIHRRMRQRLQRPKPDLHT